eukprot:jgi/Tetstr1/430297/TSEL_020122.t1
MYWLRHCLPSEVEAFTEAVDHSTVLTAVEWVLGVSFDPSTYGTDTNPMITDFPVELLHDPGSTAAACWEPDHSALNKAHPATVDLYGGALMNLPASGDAHWRVQHDAMAGALRDHCVHDVGIVVRRKVDDLFQQAVPLGNTVPRDDLKDPMPDAELSHPAINVVTGNY